MLVEIEAALATYLLGCVSDISGVLVEAELQLRFMSVDLILL
jgi:hypothetical protein